VIPKIVTYLLVGVWLFAAVIVIGYPLRSGQIRVGLRPVSRDTDPQGFWAAYIISTVLFIVVSATAGSFLHTILP
jgi:hypothetical protein